MSAENKRVKGEIPREVALKICKEIREDNERKRFGAGKMRCLFVTGLLETTLKSFAFLRRRRIEGALRLTNAMMLSVKCRKLL